MNCIAIKVMTCDLSQSGAGAQSVKKKIYSVSDLHRVSKGTLKGLCPNCLLLDESQNI